MMSALFDDQGRRPCAGSQSNAKWAADFYRPRLLPSMKLEIAPRSFPPPPYRPTPLIYFQNPPTHSPSRSSIPPSANPPSPPNTLFTPAQKPPPAYPTPVPQP